MQAIQEVHELTAEQFYEEILPGGQPAVFRGLVSDWPLVQAARTSDTSFCDYIRAFDRGQDISTAQGPASINGRLFYNADLSGLNFRTVQSRLSTSLQFLLEHANDTAPPTLAIQSAVISHYLPGMERENRLPGGLVPPDIDPRLWLGGRATVAAHYDPSENMACCVAGRRRFTLFPPEQVANLYIGPLELTPAGAAISMVDFDQPDLDRHPRFRDALAAALVADLEPGDAIYIPYLWWHHVRALDAINALVNYWWTPMPARGGDPRNALLHAMLAIRDLPPGYRAAWRSMFEHYAFDDRPVASEHLPESRRGILGDLDAADVTRLKQALARALGRQ
ncbi:cupin-like domain-containing protein [Marinihelvus fidelis]|uniref:Cupin-like domain-containing protein n=1 Tax=Marinihelvus fidelis TaxID=2613842 RepID=A0A5N0T8U9_9GAMM|nr:cupin-like domain-containing protein [Marinihelvus fidelis]KAA9130904.1 cupin-like domain-containing protein [Marinihelvus fidelis]